VLRRLPASLALVLIACCAALPACGGEDDQKKDFASCGEVRYSDQKDDGAFELQAHSASCDLAKEVATAGRSVDLGAENIDYRSAGFTCKGVLFEREDRPMIDYTCDNAGSGAVVKYTRP
jgi:hypothetical protein